MVAFYDVNHSYLLRDHGSLGNVIGTFFPVVDIYRSWIIAIKPGFRMSLSVFFFTMRPRAKYLQIAFVLL